MRSIVPSWDPDSYLRFSDYRLRPALELIERIPLRVSGFICDLGCGTGTITRMLLERWPDAAVCGVDQSSDMLAKAIEISGKIEWIQADIRCWSPDRPPDLIYSNAALHWIADHREFFPRLIGFLAPGGCLAVQMPLSRELPSHRLMRETLADGGPGGTTLGSDALRETVARRWVEDAGTYYELLSGYAARLDIWETEYLHLLEGDNPVLEWVMGTGLRPILDGLDHGQRACFLSEYGRRLREAYPARADGRTLYPFRRLFIVATI